MTPTERYLTRWVKAAARKTPLAELKRHMLRHARDLYDPTRNLPVSWTASMYNLLAMYEVKTRIKVTAGQQVYKFGKKYFRFKSKNKKWLAGPPGGKIPKNIEIVWLKAGTKKRIDEREVSIEDLRLLGFDK